MSGWNEVKTEYGCADGTQVNIKRQRTIHFMAKVPGENEQEYRDVPVALGPRNGVVCNIAAPDMLGESAGRHCVSVSSLALS